MVWAGCSLHLWHLVHVYFPRRIYSIWMSLTRVIHFRRQCVNIGKQEAAAEKPVTINGESLHFEHSQPFVRTSGTCTLLARILTALRKGCFFFFIAPHLRCKHPPMSFEDYWLTQHHRSWMQASGPRHSLNGLLYTIASSLWRSPLNK